MQERQICLKGRCRIKCLLGRVNILGYEPKDNKFVDFYSPESNSLLTLQCEFLENSAENRSKISTTYGQYIPNEPKEELPRENVVLILLRKLNSYYCDYISTLSPYQNLFKVNSSNGTSDPGDSLSCLGVQFMDQKSKFSQIRVSDDYIYVLEKWKKAMLQCKFIQHICLVYNSCVVYYISTFPLSAI